MAGHLKLTSSKVGHIAQDVQDSDQQKTERSRSLDCPNGVLDFTHDIEGILVALVGECDVDQGVGKVESVGGGSCEWILEVGGRVLNSCTPAQHDKAGDRDAGTRSAMLAEQWYCRSVLTIQG